MSDPRFLTTEGLIKAAVDKFRAPRGEKYVHAGGRGMRVRTPGEKVLYLPPGPGRPQGAVVKVTTDDSGVVTNVEEAEGLHAVARPLPYVEKRPPRSVRA